MVCSFLRKPEASLSPLESEREMATPGGRGRQQTVKAKVVLLGEGAVGKTSIVLRYIENTFTDKHVQTLQVRDEEGMNGVADDIGMKGGDRRS